MYLMFDSVAIGSGIWDLNTCVTHYISCDYMRAEYSIGAHDIAIHLSSHDLALLG